MSKGLGSFILNHAGYTDYQLISNRYIFASKYVAGKVVLDVGCGTGYGASYMAGKSASVTGIDISTRALEYAKVCYTNKGLNFVNADAMHLPFEEESFDVIVSLENIEHMTDHRKYLAGLKRVLRNDGLFICSTPNKRYFSPYTNEPTYTCHTKEFWKEEFKSLLSEFFGEVSLFGQVKVNIITLRGREITSQLLGAIPKGEQIKLAINRMLHTTVSEPSIQMGKEINEGTLDNSFTVVNLREYNILYIPKYLIATCKKE